MKILKLIRSAGMVICLIASSFIPTTGFGFVAVTGIGAALATTSPAEASRRSCRRHLRKHKSLRGKNLAFALSKDKKICGWSGTGERNQKKANSLALGLCNKIARKKGSSCELIK